ncbi:AMP-activated protein kinase [Monocercomonoides exilis]|uniref:AMP-activated protein kinase n=1 Tax=Monocercomonoides exilis TaxID=2049356 RepID=UPI00355A4F34|nr:AMP-activated protein kinase [Monocercomonoides exilis]|eukprot:MONOS_12227.1-p1 / transcript=MONOS_12227.1 / gene=MONOS_12227 / organism=Monocercomonoides_exilis_PA203 / gene_product=AMP-activated protein kinase / transcript_product=AMP-activated protein kinase / location=Mono_scaffold00662:19295-21265(-) / protein_length=657 / sequence_SO=supercontig / SO=protein_coding / is_pseudo=false
MHASQDTDAKDSQGPQEAAQGDSSQKKKDKKYIKIGSYVLKQTIGKGSFGKVKLAEHQLTGHTVAVKVLNRKRIRSLNMDSKVRREISIMKLFSHPHVIHLYEVIGTDRNIFMIMEYVPGGEMFDYIVQKGKLSEDEARRFFQQIISGVEYCHKHKVVHRDLKPENLLLDEHKNIKIADFGLSNMMRDGDFLTTSCGSPNYAAPEVISGKLYAGPGVDVWSCGVILYALLCAKLPFDDSSLEALFQKIKTGTYTIPSYIPPDVRDLISKMLTVDPVKRITIPEIRHHPWFLKNLPDYLAMPVDDGSSHRMKQIDQTIVEEICRKLHFTQEQCVRDLQRGQSNATQAAVMYALLMDQKRDMMQGQKGEMEHQSRIREFEGIELHNFVSTVGTKRGDEDGDSTGKEGDEDEDEDDYGLDDEEEEQGEMKKFDITSKKVVPIKLRSVVALSEKGDQGSEAASAQESQAAQDGSIPMSSTSPSSAYQSGSVSDKSSASASSSSDPSTCSSSSSSSASAAARETGSSGANVTEERKEEKSEKMTSQWATGVPRPVDQPRHKWSLGADSTRPPVEIMNDLFRVLRLLKFEWKMTSPYQFSCRLRQTPKLQTPRNPVEIGIQLFRLEDSTPEKPHHKIDMKRISGDTFPFMALCSAILGNLKL